MIFRLKELKGDSIAVPQLVFSKLGIAEEIHVRVALYILATGTTDPEKIAEDLKLRSRQSAERALSFWAGAGLLEQHDDNAHTASDTPPAPMTWQEIADASRTDPLIASLVECAQSCFGRSLSHSDLQKLVGLYVQEAFHPETIMLCISYLTGKNKRTIGAVVHELRVWKTEGVVTGEDADRHLHLLALREKREALVAQLLGISVESLTLGGRKAVARWYEVFGYDDTMIREAALQAGANKDIWYWNSVLKSWNAKGLRNVHDVRGNGAVSGGESRNIRVDRPEPSGNDFLKNAMDRPRRLKRKE